MRKLVLIASVAALAIPSLAAAQPGCEEQKHDSRVAGTVVGAGVGALLGGAVAGHGSKGAGAVAGAIGGGLVGNAAGGASVNCNNGYYDSRGAWHAAGGYYDSDGRWVAASSSGYYDSDGRWVATGPSGYYDRYGHWVARTPAAGAYGADASYRGAPRQLDAREDWLSRRIEQGDANGALSRYDADRYSRQLADIRRHEARMINDHDGLTEDDRADISQRLDNLSASVDANWRD